MIGSAAIEEVRTPTRDLRRAIPGVYDGFAKLHDAAFADGALDHKTKELIALGMAIVKGCEPCIALHAKAAAKLGATEQEVIETIGVAIVMDGGPSASGHGPYALASFREFAADVN